MEILVKYIHVNPVDRRLADDPLQWKWSSARWLAEQAGPIAMDDVGLPLHAGDRI